MQVNPKIQYNEEEAELTLDTPDVNPSEKPETSDIHDEADLIAAEKGQKEVKMPKRVSVKGSQVISSAGMVRQLRKNDRLIVAGCMVAGVMSVVMTYFFIVFI